MARLSRFAIAAATSAATILLLTYGTYFLRLWVGGHLSVRNFLLTSSVLLPLVLGLLAPLWPSQKVKRHALTAGTTGALIGFVYGYLAPRAWRLVMLQRTFGDWRGSGRSYLRHFDWSVC